ncbi:MAG: bifunctional heptose 7-phosphate kinase/heptose 1-phosphate adenyltransferase [Armatimonadota bacterium]
MDLNACRSALGGFAGKRVLVIGDMMLDEHIWGNVSRISPEAPVMVVNADSTSCMPGGAANVANNIRALGAEACVVGVVGDDEGGEKLKSALDGSGVDVSGIFVDKSRPTTRKTRIWASHRHQVVRVDWEDRRKIASGIVERMIDFLENATGSVDAILLSDYDKGVVITETVRAAIRIAKERGKVSMSNAKPRNLTHFAGIDLITMNRLEAGAAADIEIKDRAEVENAGRKILNTTNCHGLVITTGAQGLSAFSESGEVSHVPAVKSEVYDEAGAGDTVVSALTLAISSGLGLAGAGAIANCAGGAVVRKVGVATTTVEEIDALLVASWSRLASG